MVSKQSISFLATNSDSQSKQTKGPFTPALGTGFDAHQMHIESGLAHSHIMRIQCASSQSTSSSGLEPHSNWIVLLSIVNVQKSCV